MPQSTPPATFLLSTSSGRREELDASDADRARAAFEAFFGPGDEALYVIEEAATGDRLEIRPHGDLLTRIRRVDGETGHCEIDGPRRLHLAVTAFLGSGHAGLGEPPFRRWDLPVVDVNDTPEERGARLAAGFTTEQDALDEVMRLWADSGVVEDDHYVFFESQSRDESRADRAELLVLLDFLGLVPADLPEDAEDGEVRVPLDPRIEDVIELWA